MRIHGQRARARALVALGLSFTILLALGDHAPAGATTEEDVVQWNIAGGCSDGTCGGLTATSTLQFFIGGASPKPMTITINEMCSYQYNSIKPYLNSIGYLGVFNASVTAPNTCMKPGTTSFGNAVFQLGALVSDTGSSYFPDSDQDPAQYIPGHATRRNRRGFRCLTGNLFGYIRTGCVTHFVNKNDGYAAWPYYNVNYFTERQSSYLLYLASAASGSVRVGGDFNLTNPLNWFVNFRTLLYGGVKTHPTPNPTNQFDWFMGKLSNDFFSTYIPPYCEPSMSDHCMIAGTFYST